MMEETKNIIEKLYKSTKIEFKEKLIKVNAKANKN